MCKLTVLKNGVKHILEFNGTHTVQQVLEMHGIAMPHPCGGRGVCGKCAIEIRGAVSCPDKRELESGHRLSCRTRLYGDAEVVLKTESNLFVESVVESIQAQKVDSTAKIGAAVDIGTTTIVLSVFDLATGKCISTQSVLNPQATVAADVMGRIDAGMSGHLNELQKMVTDCIEKLAEESGYGADIDKWVITGNTTMLYLLTGRNPKALSASPFEADYLFGEMSVFNGKPLYLPKCMHAFIGADITCAVLESGMCDSGKTALLCDIGTNGELVLWKDGKLYIASTAAGPAFEGAGISCGCQSIRGAVEKVVLKNGRPEVQTIGGGKPVGLCGSGIIDAVACLLNSATIDETGAMKEEQVEICEGILLQRCDVRALQLAKAAIAAGIKTLLAVTDTAEEEIDTCYIAGGFGSHLNIRSAIRIGLIPEAFYSKVKVLGNAALKGAATMLTDLLLKEKEENIISHVTCINLGGNSVFNENYIEEMFFPEPKESWNMLRLAEEIGFSNYGLFPADKLEFRQEVRDMCAAGRCGSYGKRWTCPPYAGTLEESVFKVKRFSEGIILQMTGSMEDDFDVECIMDTEKKVKEKLEIFVERLGAEKMECLPMSAGTCTKCESCTCPQEPCRFPERAFVSMEAYGLIVSDVCKLANVMYNYGPRTITFTTCVLFNTVK